MVDCDTIDAALADAEADLQYWKDLLASTFVAIADAIQAIVSILQAGQEVPEYLQNALLELYGQRDWLQGEIDYQNDIVTQLKKDKKDCDEQGAQ